METKKTFDLATVLSLLTGKMLTPMGNLHEATDFLIGEEVYTSELAYYQEICQNAVYEKYPNLALIEVPESVIGWDAVNKFINEQKQIYGDSFELSPIPKEVIEDYNKKQKFSL